MNKSKKGSIALETAICFSILVILLASLVNAMNVYRSDIYMRRAVKDVVKDFEYFTPMNICVSDAVNTFESVLPEDFVQNYERNMSSISSSLKEYFDMEDVTNTALNLTLAHKFESCILANYIEYNDSDFYAPSDIVVDFRVDYVHRVIYVEVNYTLSTINGDINREIVDVISFWGDFFEFCQDNEVSSNEGDNFWDLGNFQRGSWLREHYNVNLPATFPVINSFSNGQATSITSIDLNSSWNLNESNLSSRLESEISDLYGFNGVHTNINGNEYLIEEGDIRSRRLVVVIPENSPESSRDLVYQYVNIAENYGITMEVVEMGNS